MTRAEGSAAASTESSDGELLDLRRVVLVTLAVLIAVAGVAAFLGWWFAAELYGMSEWFVATLGGPGVALGFIIPDALTIPIPADAFSMFGLVGGMGFWEVVAWGSLGSLMGGSGGWAIGRWVIGRSARLRARLEREGAEVTQKLHRYGVAFLALSALTPLPYSLVTWAAGATRMPYGRFLAVSSLRVIRVALYLWLVQQGWFSVVSESVS